MKDSYRQTACQLDYLMLELVHRLKIMTDREGTLTGVQFFTLRLLAREGRLKVTDIATCLGVTLSAITGLINRLYKLELVTRIQDERDRRIVWIVLTDKGRDCINLLNEKRGQILSSLLGELPQEDLDKLDEILTKIISQLD